jgi:hypothetical protein
MTADSMPHRCTFCKGFGDGETVLNGRGNYVEACRLCKGSGRMTRGDKSPGDSVDAEQAGEDDARS